MSSRSSSTCCAATRRQPRKPLPASGWRSSATVKPCRPWRCCFAVAELSSWARIALEVIPDAAADHALRTASGQLQGRLLVGVINSLGVRRDAKAVEGLIARLKDHQTDVAAAAAVALGRIGGDAAVTCLRHSSAIEPREVRSAVAEGCILWPSAVAEGGEPRQ